MFWPQVDIGLGRHETLRQAREGRGRKRVNGDAIAPQLQRGDDSKGSDTSLGGTIVGLADITIDARGRRGVNQAPLHRLPFLLKTLAPVIGRKMRGGKRAAQVYPDD